MISVEAHAAHCGMANVVKTVNHKLRPFRTSHRQLYIWYIDTSFLNLLLHPLSRLFLLSPRSTPPTLLLVAVLRMLGRSAELSGASALAPSLPALAVDLAERKTQERAAQESVSWSATDGG